MSEYDALIAGGKPNEYDAMLSGAQTAQQANLSAGLIGDPDQYAKAIQLGRTTGAPAAAIDRVMPTVEKRVRLNEYDAMLVNSPTLAGQYASSQDFARVAHDDTPTLSAIEMLLSAGVGAAKYVASAPGAAHGGLLSDVTRAARAVASGVPTFGAGAYGVAAAPFELVGADTVGGFLRDRQKDAQRTAAAWMGADPNAGLVERGVMSGLQSAGQNLALLPLGFANTARVTGEQLMLGAMGLSTGGQSYGKGRDAGLSPARAIPYAVEDAAAEVITEKFLGAAGFLQNIKAGASAAKLFMYELAREVPGEMTATLWQNFNEWQNLHPEQSVADFVRAQPAALAETIIATLVGGTTQIGAVKALQKATGATDARQEQAQAAEQAAGQIEKLAATAGQSKLRERDPQSFRQFVDQVTDAQADAPKEFYIDVQTLANTLNQAGISQAQLEQLAPAVAAQMRAENLLPGADIRLPVSELLAADPKITAPLIEHLRESPDAMSRAEAQQYMQEQGAQIEQAVAAELGKSAAQSEATQRSDSVRQHFEDQLSAANRFTATVNKEYATLLGSFYETQAARAGLSPDAFLQKYRLGISSTTTAGARQLNQGEKAPRAQLSFGEDITQTPSVISLLKGADLTSVLHESGHFFLEIQGHLAASIQARSDAGEQLTEGEKSIARDMGVLLNWFGVQGAPQTTALHDWLAMNIDEKRGHHEQFARSFEKYLGEGIAPSQELHSVFQRFRAWLLSVYKALSNLNSDLTDDVRAVMARMLASEEAIKAAEAARNLGPLFTSAEQAGMTADEYAAYQALGRQATDEAEAELAGRLIGDMRWLARAKTKALKGAQAEAAQLRRDMRTAVSKEVMAEPIYQAWQFLTGKLDVIKPGTVALEAIDTVRESGRLRSSLVKESNPEAFKVLSARHMTNENQGMHPDLVAEMFPGFTSGDQLIRALELAEEPQQVIEALTDQRMLEAYGDISSPAALERAAEAAIANDARARVLATELKAVTRATNGREGKVDVMARAAKDYADQVIARQKLKDLRPKQYSAAAARSAKLAQQSLGKLDEVALHKRNELVNVQAARAASNAQREVEAGSKYLDRVQKADLPPEYRDQIEQMLDRFDIKRSTTLKEISRRKSLMQWVESQREVGIEPDVPEYLLNEAARVSVKDLTVEEFRGLIDTIKQIEHLGRLKNKLLTAKDNREFDAVRSDLVSSILEHGKGRTADTRTPTTARGRWFQGIKNFGAAHIKAATWARIMDGGKDGGPVWERFVRGANAAGDQETTMRALATTRLSEIMAPVLKAGKMGGKGKFFPTINKSLNRESVLAIALNTGNDSNLQRLLDGEGWTANQLQPVLDSVTAAEWQAVQQVWDYFEAFRPLIAAKEMRVFGREPQWIDPKPVQTATAGTLRGGYYPVKYDPAASVRAEEHADAEAAKQQLKGAYSAATTRRSFTKTRAEEVHGRPLLYTLSGMYGGVNDVIHDLAWHEWLIDTNRLLRSQTIDEAIRGTYGPAVVRQLKTWRDAVALGDSASQEAIDGMLSRVRQGVSIAGLGFNVMSAAMQPLGITQSIVRVGAGWVGKGALQYIGAPIAKTREVNAKSEFMANRARTRFRELNELRNRVEGQTAVRERLNASAYVLMMRFQQTVDMPTWLGAYEKAIASGKDEASAVALSDQAVIDAQGGGQMKDLSAIERGGAGAKLFTVFYSFMNTALNVGVAQGMTNKNAAKTAADMALLYVVPAVLGALLKDALTPGDSGDDDKLLKKLLAEQLGFLFGLFVGAREVAEAAKTAAGLSDHPRDYSGPAGVRMFSDVAAFAKQAGQGEFDDAFRKAAINLVGDLFALPSAQINRTITGAKALSDGKTSNPAAIAFGYQEPH